MYPDDRQWERAKRLNVSQSGICNALRRLDISRKKTHQHPKACEIKRAEFIKRIEHYQSQGKTIVYLDESGFAQSMPRIHGHLPKGTRYFRTHDWQAKGRTNAIGAIIKMIFVALNLVTGNFNAEAFHAWVTQALQPKVDKGEIIVMDNAPYHKRVDTAKAIVEYG